MEKNLLKINQNRMKIAVVEDISKVVFDTNESYSVHVLTTRERIRLCLQIRPESKFAAHDETNETLMDDWKIPKYILLENKQTMNKEQAKTELIQLLENQVVDLVAMSKIELGDDVIAEINRLKAIIDDSDRK